MIFYHGNPSKRKMKKIERICPDLRHGIQFSPETLRKTKKHYFLDNGAFSDDFKEEKWINSLEKAANYKNKPDFIVLPDKFNNPEKTETLHRKYFKECKKRDLSFYVVAQTGVRPENIVSLANELGAEGIFIGGDWDKKRVINDIQNYAGRYFKTHIGMPKNFLWVTQSYVHSFDSANIVRNQSYGKLKSLKKKMKSQKSLFGW